MPALTARLFLLACLCLPAAAHAGPVTVPLAKDFVGLSYSLDQSNEFGIGEINVFVAARQVGDRLAVCGVVFFGPNATRTATRVEPRFTARTTFKMAGHVLTVPTDLFTRYPTKDAAAKGVAGCAVTGRAWDPAFAKTPLDISLSPGSLYD